MRAVEIGRSTNQTCYSGALDGLASPLDGPPPFRTLKTSTRINIVDVSSVRRVGYISSHFEIDETKDNGGGAFAAIGRTIEGDYL
jgi:hypothetical protein